MTEAVVLIRIDRIKIIHLNKGKASQIGSPPFFQEPAGPVNEMFRSFAGRQTDNPIGIIFHPFQEPLGRQQSELGEIINHDVGNAAGLERVAGAGDVFFFNSRAFHSFSFFVTRNA